MKAWAAAGFLLAAVCLGFVWFRGGLGSVTGTSDKTLQRTTAAEPGAHPAVVPALVERTAKPRQMETSPASAPFLDAYNAGVNMRAFVDNALRHPELGGYLYASKVLRECRGIAMGADMGSNVPLAYTPGEDTGKFLKMSQSMDRLRARCADFLPDELADARTQDLWRKGLAADPLIRTSAAYTAAFQDEIKSPKAAPEKAQALSDVLIQGDPLIMEELGLRLALDSENGKRGYFIDGKFYGLDSDTDVGFALYLLPCGMGLRCDEKEFDVSLNCATGGDCYASRFQQIEKTLEGTPGAYEKVMGVYQSMSAAARNGNAAFFSRPDTSATR